MFDYAERRRRLHERIEAAGVDVLFLAPSADLEYLTGVERQIPNFGEASYAHGWVTGAFFRPGRDPVFVLPRMFAAFDLREEPDGEVIVVNETDDGPAIFERAALGMGPARQRRGRRPSLGRDRAPPRPRRRLRAASDRLAARQRAPPREDGRGACRDGPRDRDRRARRWPPSRRSSCRASACRISQRRVEHELRAAGSRCPSFTTHIFTGLGDDDFDSGTATARSPIPSGTAVMFDFGGVVDGYCSDFGRTVYCGEPPADYRDAYEVMLAAHEAGRAAAKAGRDRARRQRRLPPADRGSRPRRALPPPDGPRHRNGRPRAPVPVDGGRDAARSGHDVHRRAVDHHPRPLQPPHRGHPRDRGGRRAEA